MGDVINFRQARKARKRADAESQASANRAKFGRTRAEREQAEADRRKHEAMLSGLRLERGDEPAD